jgi:hypothetical protein
MQSIIEQTFLWAASKPPDNITTVKIAMTFNQNTSDNLVCYAEGTLVYSPGHPLGAWGWARSSFVSEEAGLAQYFSNRRYGQFDSLPFDGSSVDRLRVSITWSVAHQGYEVTISSPGGPLSSFVADFDPATSVAYGSVDGNFVTISLCRRSSEPVPR